MKLRGKAALVIGAASGLGRASAEACVANGAQVMIADIDVDRAKAVLAGIRDAGGSGAVVRVDAADEATIQAAVAQAVGTFGKLDIVVNSAGGFPPHDEAGWHRSIDIFLKGTYYACRAALAEMERIGGGSIINIASIAGVTGSYVESIEGSGYSAAKHGVIGMTRTLALAYGKKGIRVNAICPGYIKAESTRRMYEAEDGGRKLISESLRVPMDRWGEAHEIGNVAAFLASDDASFITGQPIVVDGGIMAR